MNGVLRRIGVQPGERALFLSGGLSLMLMGAAASGLLNTSEALFVKRVGVESLPLALLANAGLLVVTTSLLGRSASRDAPRALAWVLLGLAVLPAPFALLADSRSPTVIGALLLVSRQVLALGMLSFWMAMGALLSPRRAKQLFAPLISGLSLGLILGSFASEPVGARLGAAGLIALCSALLATAAALGLRLRRGGSRRLERALRRAPDSRGPARVRAFELLRTSRLFQLLGTALLCGGMLSPILFFQFSSVLDAATQGPGGEQQLLGLFAHFRGWLNVAILACQVWLSAALYRRIGLPLSIALWPVAYVLGFGWLSLDFALVAAVSGLGAARVSEDGISSSAVRVLYHLFPDDVRPRVAALLSGPVARVGGALGNGVVLAALAFGGATWVGMAAFPVAVLWLASSLALWRSYPALLLRASAEHGLAGADVDRATLLDRSTCRSLAPALADPDPRVCRAAVDLVRDGDPEWVVPLLAEAVEEAPAANQPLLVEALQRLVEPLPPGGLRSEEAEQALGRALRARPPLPPELRGDLFQVLARLTAGEEAPEAVKQWSGAFLGRALGDRAAPVRLAAVAELHRRGRRPPGLPDLDRALAGALSASDPLVRRAARKELRASLLSSAPCPDWEAHLGALAHHLEQRADRAETAEALREVARRHGEAIEAVARPALRFADDRDPRVRGALLSVAGHAGLDDQAPRLVAALGARASEEAAGAREGLLALGPAAALPLLTAAKLGAPAHREAMLSVLCDFEVDGATLERLRARQLEATREAVVQRAAIDGLPGDAAGLLRRRLEERIREGGGALLQLSSALKHDPRLAELERRLRRTSGGRPLDLVIEGIEALLDRGEQLSIVPLLEPGPWSARGAAAARALGRPAHAAPEALASLARGDDASSRALARAIPLEGDDAIGDAGPVPAALDIAVLLQEVPAFDRLGTPQLLSLAELLQEQKPGEGERIFREGEEGVGLYFVLEGEVELRRGDLVLERVGPGSFFGELSVLDGVPRSCDAVASRAARLLRLDRDDLLPLLEEAPGFAIGLAQFLSARVRRLEDRLEQAASSGVDDS